MEPRVTVAGAKEKEPLVPVLRRKGVLACAVALLVVIIGAALLELLAGEHRRLNLPQRRRWLSITGQALHSRAAIQESEW